MSATVKAAKLAAKIKAADPKAQWLKIAEDALKICADYGLDRTADLTILHDIRAAWTAVEEEEGFPTWQAAASWLADAHLQWSVDPSGCHFDYLDDETATDDLKATFAKIVRKPNGYREQRAYFGLYCRMIFREGGLDFPLWLACDKAFELRIGLNAAEIKRYFGDSEVAKEFTPTHSRLYLPVE